MESGQRKMTSDEIFNLNTGSVGCTPIKKIKNHQQQQQPPSQPQIDYRQHQQMDYRQTDDESQTGDSTNSDANKKRTNKKIKKLVSNIETSIIKKKKLQQKKKDDTNDNTNDESANIDSDAENDEQNNVPSDYQNDIYELSKKAFFYAKDGFIIVILYLILSQDFIQNTLKNYITILANSENPYSTIINQVIYAIILAVLFLLSRHILQ